MYLVLGVIFKNAYFFNAGNAKMNIRRTQAERGFTIVEALVALVVIAFGMLAIVGFQLNVSRNSDVARQRAEAVRLAQDRLEELRAFQRVTTLVGERAYNDIVSEVSTNVTPTNSNTTYSRTTTVTTAGELKLVTVSVAWVDRANETYTVSLNTVISESDPSRVGGLTMPPIDNGILRRPKGRDINIPIPAVKLGGENAGKSKLAFASDVLVFSDALGDVVYLCTNTAIASITDNSSSLSGCIVTTAYLLTGFISSDPSNDLPAATNLRVRFVLGTKPDGTTALATDVSGTPKCIFANATDQNNGSVISGYRSYVCLVTPTDHTAPVSPATLPPSGKHWSAKVELTTNNATALSQKICRYGYTPLSTDTTVDNSRHPPTYMYVTETLDSQNFILKSSGNCSSISAIEQQSTLPAGCLAGALVSGVCPP